MERLFSFIIKKRKLILIIAAVAFIAAGISMTQTRLNSDVARYLPDDSASKQTIEILRDSFGINGDAEICAQGTHENYRELSAIVGEISALDEVTEVQWLGSYDGLFRFEDGRLVSADPAIPDENVRSLTEGFYLDYEGESYYLITISLEAANATDEATAALEKIGGIMEGYSLPYELGGNAVQSNDMLVSALGELPMFLVVALVVILIILLATTPSLVSAGIFLLTIGVSIVYNLGTNFFTPDISTITFSVAAILQLALSMDYSIFLTHSFENARNTMSDEAAMAQAIKKTLVVIAASALTTIAGFCALFAMKYTMGFDMGLCLAKGVAFSFITVIFIQPCLMLCLRKACDKTTHKYLNPSFGWLSRLPAKLRNAAPIAALVLLIPSAFIALSLNYYYLDSGYVDGADGPKGAAQAAGNHSIIVCETVSAEKQFELAGSLKNLDGVGAVTGYYSMLQDISQGISLPVYSSLTDQNEDTLIFTLEPTEEEIADLLEGDGSLLEERVRSKLSAYAASIGAERVTQAMNDRAAALGRPLTQEERQAVTGQVTAELSDELSELAEAQLGSLSGSLEKLSGQLEEYRDKFFADIDGTEYTFITAKVYGEPEGPEALATITAIESSVRHILDVEDVYISGNTSTVRDLEQTTKTDLYIVAGLSALLILIILLFTFRDFLTSILLILVIELAIFINLSISHLMGSQLNFMSYIVISAIQLGATIDYAILLTKTFRSEMETASPFKAVARAVKTCACPIVVSMCILGGACLSVYFVSTDTIIREITMLIARGALISGIMVLFVLPPVLIAAHPKKLMGGK